MTRVLFFMPSLAGGGAERVTLDLCRALAAGGDEVTLVLAHEDGELATGDVSGGTPLRVVDLGVPRTVACLGPLARLVRRERPDVIVGVLIHAGLVSVVAGALARSRATRLVMLHNTLSENARRSPRRRDRVVPMLCRPLLRRTTVTAVSRGVAEDFAALTGVPSDRVVVLPNPIDYPRIERMGSEPFEGPRPPLAHKERLAVAAGRLVEQKDFGTLVEAARLLADPALRVVVLGDGPDRAELEEHVRRAGMEGRVQLLGRTENPFPWFRAADLFVLSSRWEGLPTVLLEVLAFDTPIVATDCPSGPREILEGGRLGTLVPVGRPDELAAAMRATLDAGDAGVDPCARAEVRGEFLPSAVAARFRSLW